ncbi:hypothetical protein Misp01_70660 [Microtetraspora sp. NBRC 13810]|uniref:DUF6571 family protein n=1 Tax=Microtetraspora sp. NBRC 13810 TaxID=3030990 RepID=UPI0024A1F30B|nr:DUF6571 family protein [Microtetraspora sp. NBRC 13810]GLW11938.1 hypothetical protein Misp01_70660 [Microtetraspora sp. NBRC 13810]
MTQQPLPLPHPSAAHTQPPAPSPTASPGPQPSPRPQEPPPTPATFDDEFSGIDPALMDRFEQGLGRAESAIGRNEPQIRRTLEQLDLDTSPLAALREVQSWIGERRPDLRRRGETIRTTGAEWGAAAATPGGLTPLDEALYGKTTDPDVYAALFALAKTTKDGEIDRKALAQLDQRKGDQTFALALLNALGGNGLRQVLAATVKEKEDKELQPLQAALGKMLGTASPKLTTAWRDELTSDLKQQQEYGISMALMHGTFDATFLLGVAKKIDDWDRNAGVLDGRPAGRPWGRDPMVGVMEALARTPAAAQDFFKNDPSLLKWHLLERNMSDQGVSLGKALEAATLTFRDHEGSPQNPSRGFVSARLASEIVHLEFQRIDEGHDDSRLPPTTTAKILAGYIKDVDRVAATPGNTSVGVYGGDFFKLPGQDPWGAQFARDELRTVMKEAFGDTKAFATVLAAQTGFSKELFDRGAAEIAAGKGDALLTAGAQQAGSAFGMITDAAGLSGIEKGKELDEAQERNVKALLAVVNTGLAIPQAGTWPIAAGVVAAWTGTAEGLLKGDAEDRARDDADTTVEQTRGLVHDLTAQAMLKHGLFGPPETGAENHPWGSLEGLAKGDDPRDNPNNFLKDDGQTLMTTDEMIDDSATNTTEKYQRLDAYRRWLYSGLAGSPWQDAQTVLDTNYSIGFSKYGS